jgi:hypothetical protein
MATRITKGDLLRLLEPYAIDEQIVFVAFDDGIVVHEHIDVAKDHSTTRTGADGRVSMPVAIYLVDDGQPGQGGMLGVAPEDIRLLTADLEKAISLLDELLSEQQLNRRLEHADYHMTQVLEYSKLKLGNPANIEQMCLEVRGGIDALRQELQKIVPKDDMGE